MIDEEEEKKAFEMLYINYKNLMLYVARQILNNREEAEDAVAEAFLRIAKNFEKIHKEICPKTANLFVVIVRNISMDMYRKNKKTDTVELDENLTEADISQYDVFEIEQAFEKLKNIDRDILYLFNLYGYNAKEIAKLFNTTENTIYKRISRAKTNLKRLLEEDDNE